MVVAVVIVSAAAAVVPSSSSGLIISHYVNASSDTFLVPAGCCLFSDIQANTANPY